MKHHILVKFLAIVLCAAALLGVAASGLGMVALHEMGLYQRTVEEAYAEYAESMARNLASRMAERYASGALGGMPTQMQYSIYPDPYSSSSFDWSRISYTIRDENGEEVYSMLQEEYPVRHSFSFPVTGEYLQILNTMTMEEYQAMQTPAQEEKSVSVDGRVIYDALPETGAEIYSLDVSYDDGSGESTGGVDSLGVLRRNDSGIVFFSGTREFTGLEMLDGTNEIIYICFRDASDRTVYEMSGSPGSGVLAHYSTNGDGAYLELWHDSQTPGEDPALTEVVPGDSIPVWRVEYRCRDGATTSLDRGSALGSLVFDDEGNVLFTSFGDVATGSAGVEAVDAIVFYDMDGGIILEASLPDYTGYLVNDGVGRLSYYSIPAAAEETVFHNAIPEEGTPVVRVTVTYADDFSESTGGVPQIGTLSWEDGQAVFRPQAGVLEYRSETVVHIAFHDAEENLVFEARDLTGVGSFAMEEEQLVFRSAKRFAEAPEETAVPVTAEATEAAEDTRIPEATAVSELIPETTAASEPIPEEALHYHIYFDGSTGMDMMAQYVHVPMPEYTVEVAFADGALTYEYEWTLLGFVNQFRQELPLVLGVGVLVFALLLVYLCCAAAKHPGSTEIRPGGLNRLPLDGYFCLICLGLAGLAVMGVEGTQYILRSNTQLGILYAGICGYSACLLVVAFLFACAAQFKSPDGYWWRGSLFGLSMKLVVILWNMSLRFIAWLWEKLRLWVWPVCGKLLRWLLEVTKAIMKFLWNWVLVCLALLKQSWEKLKKAFLRFFAMLPLTWQWLLVGSVMIFALFITVAGRYDVGIVLSILFAVALVIYGAHAFGVLLESAKRMSKGDLDEKVDDKLLIGAFQDFADELNGLADVAVVAAQKQLRSERMKTELITNVSHDIKTPLTSIINYVDLLEKPHTEEEQAVYLEVLSRQSQRLKKLIEDLMEMSKASTGNLAVEITQVDAAEAINQSLGEFADKLEKARLTPVFRQPEKTVEMMADGRLVWRVMSNLLGNAVKYALPGTRLYVDLMQADGKVIISMKNISRESLNVSADELLERFVRGDVSRNTEGSGLGLNIAQSLMEVQKGQLQLLVDGDLFKVTLIFPGV